MKSQPKLHLPQLNLPLLDQSPAVIPADKNEQLVHALVELLLVAAGNPNVSGTDAGGRQDEPEADH